MHRWRATTHLRQIGRNGLFGLSLLLSACLPAPVRTVEQPTGQQGKKTSEVHTSDQAGPHTPLRPPGKKPSSTVLPARVVEEPDPPVIYAQVPPGGQLFGSPGGVAVEAMSEAGHWVAYCQGEGQSREQDVPTDARGTATEPLAVTFAMGSEELPIDALLAHESSGRHAVVLQNGKPLLVDALTRQVHDLSSLSPDLRADALPDHRSFSFSDRGLAMLTVGTKNDGAFLPLPLKSTGEAKGAPAELPAQTLQAQSLALDFGAREAFRIEAGPGFIRAITLTEGSGEKAWPIPARPAPAVRCAAERTPFSAYPRMTSFRPDPALETSWLALPKTLRPGALLQGALAPGYVMSTPQGWVRRENTGRTLLVHRGTQKQIASSRCGARFLHADAETGLFLASCEEYRPKPPSAKEAKARKRTRPKYRFDLYLIRPGFVRNLKADTARTGVDVKGASDTPFPSLRPGREAALVDFKKRTLRTLQGDAFVLATGTSGALIRRGSTLSLWTRDSEEKLDVSIDELGSVVTAPHSIAIGAELFLLSPKWVHHRLPGAPLAINDAGFALIAKEPSTSTRLPRGPLLLLPPPVPDTATPKAAAPENPSSDAR